FESASYLGQTLPATVLTFDANKQAIHPLAKDSAGRPVVVTGDAVGDQLVVLQLPFNSFTPNQSIATVNVSVHLSNLADIATPLTLHARGGFYLGTDPLDNPTADPSILGARVDATVQPAVVTLTTTYLGPEDETATGPNFPRQYKISVGIGAG